eukprot:CAMPEP_0180563806 /NCGR_PEP_ID=MMETSP1037_2-20121125/4675_1 /TAXON_ID=632150 /ORGANISM="Azadinium spinosum, Strain 3D9" /LENGTH=122 /DNA_ID=CAMNT_0022580667 /DNA_START=71 /DNA_END=436 /DNA_ORIENTATION=-
MRLLCLGAVANILAGFQLPFLSPSSAGGARETRVRAQRAPSSLLQRRAAKDKEESKLNEEELDEPYMPAEDTFWKMPAWLKPASDDGSFSVSFTTFVPILMAGFAFTMYKVVTLAAPSSFEL